MSDQAELTSDTSPHENSGIPEELIDISMKSSPLTPSSKHQDELASTQHLNNIDGVSTQHLNSDRDISTPHLNSNDGLPTQHLNSDDGVSTPHLNSDDSVSIQHLDSDDRVVIQHLGSDRGTSTQHMITNDEISTQPLNSADGYSIQHSDGGLPTQHLNSDDDISTQHWNSDRDTSTQYIITDDKHATQDLNGDDGVSTQHDNSDDYIISNVSLASNSDVLMSPDLNVQSLLSFANLGSHAMADSVSIVKNISDSPPSQASNCDDGVALQDSLSRWSNGDFNKMRRVIQNVSISSIGDTEDVPSYTSSADTSYNSDGRISGSSSRTCVITNSNEFLNCTPSISCRSSPKIQTGHNAFVDDIDNSLHHTESVYYVDIDNSLDNASVAQTSSCVSVSSQHYNGSMDSMRNLTPIHGTTMESISDLTLPHGTTMENISDLTLLHGRPTTVENMSDLSLPHGTMHSMSNLTPSSTIHHQYIPSQDNLPPTALSSCRSSSYEASHSNSTESLNLLQFGRNSPASLARGESPKPQVGRNNLAFFPGDSYHSTARNSKRTKVASQQYESYCYSYDQKTNTMQPVCYKYPDPNRQKVQQLEMVKLVNGKKRPPQDTEDSFKPRKSSEKCVSSSPSSDFAVVQTVGMPNGQEAKDIYVVPSTWMTEKRKREDYTTDGSSYLTQPKYQKINNDSVVPIPGSKNTSKRQKKLSTSNHIQYCDERHCQSNTNGRCMKPISNRRTKAVSSVRMSSSRKRKEPATGSSPIDHINHHSYSQKSKLHRPSSSVSTALTQSKFIIAIPNELSSCSEGSSEILNHSQALLKRSESPLEENQTLKSASSESFSSLESASSESLSTSSCVDISSRESVQDSSTTHIITTLHQDDKLLQVISLRELCHKVVQEQTYAWSEYQYKRIKNCKLPSKEQQIPRIRPVCSPAEVRNRNGSCSKQSKSLNQEELTVPQPNNDHSYKRSEIKRCVTHSLHKNSELSMSLEDRIVLNDGDLEDISELNHILKEIKYLLFSEPSNETLAQLSQSLHLLYKEEKTLLKWNADMYHRVKHNQMSKMGQLYFCITQVANVIIFLGKLLQEWKHQPEEICVETQIIVSNLYRSNTTALIDLIDPYFQYVCELNESLLHNSAKNEPEKLPSGKKLSGSNMSNKGTTIPYSFSTRLSNSGISTSSQNCHDKSDKFNDCVKPVCNVMPLPRYEGVSKTGKCNTSPVSTENQSKSKSREDMLEADLCPKQLTITERRSVRVREVTENISSPHEGERMLIVKEFPTTCTATLFSDQKQTSFKSDQVTVNSHTYSEIPVHKSGSVMETQVEISRCTDIEQSMEFTKSETTRNDRNQTAVSRQDCNGHSSWTTAEITPDTGRDKPHDVWMVDYSMLPNSSQLPMTEITQVSDVDVSHCTATVKSIGHNLIIFENGCQAVEHKLVDINTGNTLPSLVVVVEGDAMKSDVLSTDVNIKCDLPTKDDSTKTDAMRNGEMMENDIPKAEGDNPSIDDPISINPELIIDLPEFDGTKNMELHEHQYEDTKKQVTVQNADGSQTTYTVVVKDNSKDSAPSVEDEEDDLICTNENDPKSNTRQLIVDLGEDSCQNLVACEDRIEDTETQVYTSKTSFTVVKHDTEEASPPNLEKMEIFFPNDADSNSNSSVVDKAEDAKRQPAVQGGCNSQTPFTVVVKQAPKEASTPSVQKMEIIFPNDTDSSSFANENEDNHLNLVVCEDKTEVAETQTAVKSADNSQTSFAVVEQVTKEVYTPSIQKMEIVFPYDTDSKPNNCTVDEAEDTHENFMVCEDKTEDAETQTVVESAAVNSKTTYTVVCKRDSKIEYF